MTDRKKDVLEILGVTQDSHECINNNKKGKEKEGEESVDKKERDVDVDEKDMVFWKLDPSEDPRRRRMKMRRNYKGSRHLENSYEKFVAESNRVYAEKELASLTETLKEAQLQPTDKADKRKSVRGNYLAIFPF